MLNGESYSLTVTAFPSLGIQGRPLLASNLVKGKSHKPSSIWSITFSPNVSILTSSLILRSFDLSSLCYDIDGYSVNSLSNLLSSSVSFKKVMSILHAKFVCGLIDSYFSPRISSRRSTRIVVFGLEYLKSSTVIEKVEALTLLGILDWGMRSV